MIIIDASIAVKLYRDEAQSDIALALFADHNAAIFAPDIFAVEVMGAMVREANMRFVTEGEFRAKLASFQALLNSPALTLLPTSPGDVAKAALVAADMGHPIRDCIYLVLAMERNCQLVTADTKFALKGREVWGGVKVLGE